MAAAAAVILIVNELRKRIGRQLSLLLKESFETF